MNDARYHSPIPTPALSPPYPGGRPALSLQLPSQTPLDDSPASTPDAPSSSLLQFCQTPANLPTPDTSTVYMTPNPSKKSHAKKQPPGHVPRPRNPFILFRCDLVRQGKLPQAYATDHKNISKVAGIMWKSLSVEQKEPWARMAKLEKSLHAERYPGYSYHPGRGAAGYGDVEVKAAHAERGCSVTGEGRKRERRTMGRRAVKKEELDEQMPLWLPDASELSSSGHMQVSTGTSESLMHQDFHPRLHQPQPVSVPFPVPSTSPSPFSCIDYNYRIYHRRSSSCPPPGAFPVSGHGQEAPILNASLRDRDRPLYLTTPSGTPLTVTGPVGTVGMPFQLPVGIGIDQGLSTGPSLRNGGTTHDDIIYARRPSRVTMYHSYHTMANSDDSSSLHASRMPYNLNYTYTYPFPTTPTTPPSSTSTSTVLTTSSPSPSRIHDHPDNSYYNSSPLQTRTTQARFQHLQHQHQHLSFSSSPSSSQPLPTPVDDDHSPEPINWINPWGSTTSESVPVPLENASPRPHHHDVSESGGAYTGKQAKAHDDSGASDWGTVRWGLASRDLNPAAGRGRGRDEGSGRNTSLPVVRNLVQFQRPISPRTVTVTDSPGPDCGGSGGVTVKMETRNDCLSEWSRTLGQPPLAYSGSHPAPDVPAAPGSFTFKTGNDWLPDRLGGLRGFDVVLGDADADVVRDLIPQNHSHLAKEAKVFDGPHSTASSNPLYSSTTSSPASVDLTTLPTGQLELQQQFASSSPPSDWVLYTQNETFSYGNGNENENISPSSTTSTASPLLPSDGIVIVTNLKSGCDGTSDLGTLFPRLSLDENTGTEDYHNHSPGRRPQCDVPVSVSALETPTTASSLQTQTQTQSPHAHALSMPQAIPRLTTFSKPKPTSSSSSSPLSTVTRSPLAFVSTTTVPSSAPAPTLTPSPFGTDITVQSQKIELVDDEDILGDEDAEGELDSDYH